MDESTCTFELADGDLDFLLQDFESDPACQLSSTQHVGEILTQDLLPKAGKFFIIFRTF